MPKVGASNSAASTVAAPVDGIDLGTPIMGSGWMAQKGPTAQPQNHAAGLAGEAVGGVAPLLAAAKATNIIEGLLAIGNRVMQLLIQ